IYADIEVYPEAVLHLEDSISLLKGESQQVFPTGNCLYFSWFPSLGLSNTAIKNPLVSPQVNTRYFINGRTEHGCNVFDSIDVYVRDVIPIEIPNAFSPGSRPNDELKILNTSGWILNRFEIYD